MIARSACLYDVIYYTRSSLHLCVREDCDRMLVYVLSVSLSSSANELKDGGYIECIYNQNAYVKDVVLFALLYDLLHHHVINVS